MGIWSFFIWIGGAREGKRRGETLAVKNKKLILKKLKRFFLFFSLPLTDVICLQKWREHLYSGVVCKFFGGNAVAAASVAGGILDEKSFFCGRGGEGQLNYLKSPPRVERKGQAISRRRPRPSSKGGFGLEWRKMFFCFPICSFRCCAFFSSLFFAVSFLSRARPFFFYQKKFSAGEFSDSSLSLTPAASSRPRP